MTTFTTEDRILAEKDGSLTVNVEPIPFAGLVTLTESAPKSKPVAYINVEERKLEWAEPITWHTPTIAKMDKIPLFAHLAKELTNAEISDICNKFLAPRGGSIFTFARAILRKAQEKK